MATPTTTSPPRAASLPPAPPAAKSLLSEGIAAARSVRSYETIASDDEAEACALSPPLMQGLTSYFLPRLSPPPEPVELTTMEKVCAVFSRWCVCFGSHETDGEEEEDDDDEDDEENERSSSSSAEH